jgi:TonB-linked SusC/RagA family outer membrane protein
MKKKLTFSRKKRFSVCRNIYLLLLILFMTQLQRANGNENTTLQDGKKVITGVVTDGTTGEVLTGVSILIKGTNTGAVTDIDGKFTISAEATDVLVFNLVGYLSEEVTVGDQTTMNVTLSPDLIGLNEVVVVGYGVQQKKLVTGATVQVKNEDITKNNVTRLESSLQGITPGMIIVQQSGQPGSDFNINIRGLGSVNGSNPLVLIDGVPSNINAVNPNDVATVDVLKDAASAAIYGSRAADGVILITTKKGKAGEAKVNYDFHYGISNPIRQVSMLNASEYAMLQNEAFENTNNNANLNPPFRQGQIDSLGVGTNWQEEATNHNAPLQSHYLGITQGNDKSNYLLSLSYDKQEGIFDYDNKSLYERIGFSFNSVHKLKKYLTMGENFNYSHRNQNGLGVTDIYNNFMRNLLLAEPIMKAYDPSYPDGFGRSDLPSKPVDMANPLGLMYYQYNEKKHRDDIIGDIYAEIQIIQGLKFKSDFGGTFAFQNNTTANDSFTLAPQVFNPIPNYEQYMSRDFSCNWDNILSYDKDFGKNNFTFLIGTNLERYTIYNVDPKMYGYLANPNLEPALTNVVSLLPSVPGDTIEVKGDFGPTDSRESVFGRINYNYNEKYLLMASLRRDGSSRFGSGYRYGYFPAVSAGWVITNESFMSNTSWLDFLKIRASWGENGKEPNLPYRALATVSSTYRSYPIGNALLVGTSPDKLPNRNLKWESSIQTDFGFDAKFLRVFSVNFDYYKKTSGDWIVPTTVPGITGIQGISSVQPYFNGGNIVNKGVELQLGYFKNLGDLSISVQANGAYNKQEVTDVPGGVIQGASSVLTNGSASFYRVEDGYPLGYFYGYKTDGLFQSQEDVDNYVNSEGVPLQRGAKPGDVKRVDVNNDGVIDSDDRTKIGDPNPHYTYGVNINLNYKGLDFSMNLYGQGGNQIFKGYRDVGRSYVNSPAEDLDRWHWVDNNNNGIVDPGEGIGNTIPRVTGGKDANNNWRFISDLYIKPGGFMRVKSINLGYDLKTLFKKLPVEKLRIYVSATNILTFTKYDGLDPEVGYGSFYNSDGILTDPYASHIDLGFYPTPRTYLAGINVTL